MKKEAIYLGYSEHDCESWYKCPVCGKKIGDWKIFNQTPNENGTQDYCPKCKTELKFRK